MLRKIKLFLALAFSALLLTMCRFYDEGERVTTINGLSCQAYTDYFGQGSAITKGLECYYECPQEVVGPLDFESDPSLSASKADLDRLLCGITEPAASASPIPIVSATPIASATAQASPTATISPTAPPSLLTGQTTMCDLGANLINFRMVEPVPDLTDKTLTIEIADIETTCTVNPTNPSLLTCTIPSLVTFPARVVVSLDGAVVNDFTYEGIGCDELTTPMPTTTP
jgi:hypothetical protein